jgi:hypothetical protein
MIVSMKNWKRINTLIGFSIKSRQVLFGSDTVLSGKNNSVIGAILVDKNLSENAQKKLNKWLETRKCRLWILSNWEDLTAIKTGVKVISILKGTLCDAIIKTFLEEEYPGSENDK